MPQQQRLQVLLMTPSQRPRSTYHLLRLSFQFMGYRVRDCECCALCALGLGANLSSVFRCNEWVHYFQSIHLISPIRVRVVLVLGLGSGLGLGLGVISSTDLTRQACHGGIQSDVQPLSYKSAVRSSSRRRDSAPPTAPCPILSPSPLH